MNNNSLKNCKALTVALNLMLARLEEGYAKLSQFSEDLAHEMRTPLNNLMIRQLTLSQPRTFEDYEHLLDSQQGVRALGAND